MSHHGHEDAMERFYTECDRERLPHVDAKLNSAIQLITEIANDIAADPGCACDSWLELNGYECEASRRRQRERRADDLDAEIARLQRERGAL